jgi:hypothetical protein
MDRGRQFEPKFRHVDRNSHHSIEAYDGLTDLGSLDWHKKTGEITSVITEKSYRRMGVATDMLKEAHRIAVQNGFVTPVHSGTRTDDGDAWSQAMGAPPAEFHTTMSNLESEDDDDD